MMVRVLNKDPAATFVVIEEADTDNWGIGGQSVTVRRRAQQR
jgi:4-oxalocrotonate tautomerase